MVVRIYSLVAFLVLMSIGTVTGAENCFDLSKPEATRLAGQLRFEIFPGPPNFEDVRAGDSPEPAYILTLVQKACFLDEGDYGSLESSEVQLLVDVERA